MSNEQKVGMSATYITIWFSQLVSLVGDSLTSFALGIWVYQRTGSITDFAMISVFSMLPGILLSPVAGAYVDRLPRRIVLIVSDSGAGLSTLVLGVLLFTGRLEIWQIWIALSVSSCCSAFRWPAYYAATSLMVPKDHLGRANGMIKTAEAAGFILGPIVGAALLVTIQIHGVILVDFGTFLFSLVVLLLTRIPELKASTSVSPEKKHLLREAAFGWRYITARSGLSGLLVFFAIANLVMGGASVLITPLLLTFTTTKTLGTVMSIGGSGYLAGAVAMSTWGGPKRKVYGMLGFQFLAGFCIAMAGLISPVPLLAALAFVFFFCVALVHSCNQVIWQTKVPHDVQGRVLSVVRMLAWSCTPLAYFLSGPLADRVFEPLLARGGALESSVGLILGTGPGRGIALMLILLGCLTTVATIGGYLYKRVRWVETELPDASLPEEAPYEEAPAGLQAAVMAESAG